MADETLRRSLDAAFDPGPDFPTPLLLSRTMAALNVDAGSAAPGRNRKIHGQYSLTWLRPGLRLTAVLMAVILAVAGAAAFLALHAFSTSAPAQSHPSSVSRSCSQGNLHMVSASVGWNGTFRTTDGGVTWNDVSPPWLANETKSARVGCFLDATHAWVTEVVGSSEAQPGQLFIFATHNGGVTWQESIPVPIAGAPPDVQLQFIDARHGWLLTDSGLYASEGATTRIYTTQDGGLHWSQVAISEGTAASLELQTSTSCRPSGMTFDSVSQGWLTWDCITHSFFSFMTVVALTTNDGGRNWVRVNLEGGPFGTLPGPNLSWNCGASAAVFDRGQGVIPVSCALFDEKRNGLPTGSGWSETAQTSDAGITWYSVPLPGYVELSQVDFIDASTGFAFVKGALGNDLYSTTNAGRDWTIVSKGLFLGQQVTNYQFIDAVTGFAFTDHSPDASWKTTDGGRTWALPSP